MKREFDEFELAQDLIKCYVASRQGLTKLGILRSERNLQGDYAEWLVGQRFGLQLAPSTIQKGYDATDKQGRTYQIKSRIVKTPTQSTSFDFAREETDFDFLVGVFFSPSFDLLGVICAPSEVVRESRVKNARNSRFRWNKNTAQDPRVTKWVWEEELRHGQN